MRWRQAVLLPLLASCRLGFESAPDAASNDASDGVTDAEVVPPLRVFVTSTQYTGRLAYAGKTGVTAGDAICTDTAAAAGMTGTFAAWLSDDTRNAIDLLVGSTGWVRIDGAPFAETVNDLATDHVFTALSLDETSQSLPLSDRIWLGGSRGGMTESTDTCAGFTDEVTGMATFRETHLAGQAGTSFAPCAQTSHLACMEYGRQATVPFNGTGRYAFGVELWTGTSLASADAACTTKAMQLGLPGSYVAGLATSTQSIEERAGSLAGPWQLPRNIPITDGPLGGTLRSPIGLGGRQYLVWLGAPSLTARQGNPGLSCNDWTTDVGTNAVTGNLAYDLESEWLTRGFTIQCNSTPVGLLCLQHD